MFKKIYLIAFSVTIISGVALISNSKADTYPEMETVNKTVENPVNTNFSINNVKSIKSEESVKSVESVENSQKGILVNYIHLMACSCEQMNRVSLKNLR
ncbi:hypothetical protein ACFQ3J_19740 [Paenibacillus provencensis]|uniref:Uncharacterized protein n=1 Tax=Paenibacillus provencensis TaxID=441151 RepID=A0ABW3PUD6_9BACL|nr:hypothetical protein [Paenibacillus sp. MER 78]MCM3129357.1 hypothetical protein [Paenibacillus sp. MER 78]